MYKINGVMSGKRKNDVGNDIQKDTSDQTKCEQVKIDDTSYPQVSKHLQT